MVILSRSEVLASFAAVLSDSGTGTPFLVFCIRFSSLGGRFRNYWLELQTPGPSLQPRQAMLEPFTELLAGASRDRAQAPRSLKLGKSVAGDHGRPLRFANMAFVIDRELFVSFEAFLRTSEHAFPQIARPRKIAFA